MDDMGENRENIEVALEGGKSRDPEKVASASGSNGGLDHQAAELAVSRPGRPRWCYVFLHLLAWMVMTGWWITGLVLHRNDLGWVVPFLVWLGLSVRLATLHISTKPLADALTAIYNRRVLAPLEPVPQGVRMAILAMVTLGAVVVGTFATPVTASNSRSDRAVSLLGWAVILGVFYAASRDRTHIDFQPVLVGVLAQFLLALFIFRTQVGYDIFDFLGSLARILLGYAGDGASFLTSPSALSSGWFLITVLPPMIFFVSLVQLLYYWGWLPWFVGKAAVLVSAAAGISGAEAVVAAASPFLGQGESAALVRTLLPALTLAELHQVMASGFATIAGSVLAAYVAMGVSPLALVSSCAMSIPAAVALSKLRWPETETPLTRGRRVVDIRTLPIPEGGGGSDEPLLSSDSGDSVRAANSLHAVAAGSWLGLKIAGMVAASVLCVLALLGLVNGLLGWWGSYLDLPSLSVQLIAGYVFYPVAFLLGVSRFGNDLLLVARLIGIKVVANEFVAYGDLTQDATYASLTPRSRLIAMYALCGFGNISAVGIQIGALSQLAPSRAGAVAQVAASALITGIMATLTSANIAGMLMAES